MNIFNENEWFSVDLRDFLNEEFSAENTYVYSSSSDMLGGIF